MSPTNPLELIAGRYRLDSLLGRGGMGEVRAGTDLRLDRAVAIKLLRADLAHQAELRARFEREARAAARISHPNVVAVFDSGEHEGVPFIVMERLPGGTVADEVATGTLSQARACTLILEILSALEAAHQLGILHRDIKPGNILLSGDGHAKVADFGIAKVAEDSDPRTTGILFGTAEYLAPERLEGEPATAASDLYSVGVVLFEALAGRPPFQAETPLGLVASISGDRPPSLAELRPDVDPAVITVTEQAMAKAPGRRFASASTMAASLRAAIEPSSSTEKIDASSSIENQPTVPIATTRSTGRAPDPSPIAVTQILAPAPPPVEAPIRPRRLKGHAKQWFAGTIALVAIIVVVVVVAVLASSGDEPSPSQPASPNQTTGSTAIPAPLRQAIDQLDRAVQP